MNQNSSKLISNSPNAKYYSLIQEFIKHFFIGKDVSLSHQFLKNNQTVYWPYKGELTVELLTEHFYIDPNFENKYPRGSLAVKPLYKNQYLKFICFDLDNENIVKKAEDKLLPKLKELGIEYLTEYGGNKLERRHIWIKTECKYILIQEFITNLLMHLYGYKTPIEPYLDQQFEEVFGVNKPDNLIRIPLGYHLTRHKRFPIELPTGELSTNPVDFLQLWINLTPLTDERLIELIKQFPVEKVEKSKQSYFNKQFNYFPRKLLLPIDIPQLLIPVVSNCQAINSLLEDVRDNKMIHLPGDIHHYAGLFLAGLAAYNDGKKSKNRDVKEGKNWFKELRNKYRFRDDASHQWDSTFKTAKSDPDRVFASCNKWEEKFNKCEGCPFKDVIQSPKEFIYGQPIIRKLVEPVKLITSEEIKKTTFIHFKNHIKQLAKYNLEEDILLSSPMGSGKSRLVDEIAADLSKDNKKILIAVPTTRLALEHKECLKKLGVDSFVLASHKSIFDGENKLSKFPCPAFDEIQKLINLGVSSTSVKSNYCKSCPYFEDCYYPKQYKQVLEPEHKIVIIQHAHLSNQEVIYDLMKKQFDALFIDESFINICYTSLPILKSEIDLLKELQHLKWCQKLFRWLRGEEKANGVINPTPEDLELVHKLITASNIPWRIPDLIRFYNQKKLIDKHFGIEVIYEMPQIPIRVFTDATPPEDLIKKLVGIEKLTVFGRSEILDYRKIHPENKVIQVLDNSTSVTSLSDDNKFNAILMKIAELVELVYTNHKILLTIYKKDFIRVEKFFLLHQKEFPTALNRITIDRIEKGTNKYVDYDVQFLLMGIYYTGKQTLIDTYKYKAVANYYNIKNNRPTISNIFPANIDGPGSIPQERYFVRRIEPLKNQGAIFEYETFNVLTPVNIWHQYCYNFNIANTQQAIRLRFKPNKPRIIYILNNLFLPSMLITESITLEDFIKPVS